MMRTLSDDDEDEDEDEDDIEEASPAALPLCAFEFEKLISFIDTILKSLYLFTASESAVRRQRG